MGTHSTAPALQTNVEMKQIRTGRADAAAYFADALDGLYAGEPSPAPLVGGRTAGLTQLKVFNTADYQARRNDVGPTAGASRLSPYIRHGCITLTEAKDDALVKIGPSRAYKFIQELAWRQFWQIQWARLGDRIFHDLEEPKVPLGRDNQLPADIADAQTGLACIDKSLTHLYSDGYMINHARMWVAAYLVHHRKLTWQTGAMLFYRFLLDGDPASNNLSWQWIASTFSHKPYIFNRSNVEKYSRHSDGTTYCTDCPAARNNTCPFDATYEVLGKRLFGKDYDADSGYGRGGARGTTAGKTGKSRDRDMAPRRSSERG